MILTRQVLGPSRSITWSSFFNGFQLLVIPKSLSGTTCDHESRWLHKTPGLTFTFKSSMTDLKLTLWFKQAIVVPVSYYMTHLVLLLRVRQELLQDHKRPGKHPSIDSLKSEILIFRRTNLNLVGNLKILRRFALVSLQTPQLEDDDDDDYLGLFVFS